MALWRTRRAVGRRRQQPEQGPADLHDRIGHGKPYSSPVERRRDRGRQHEPTQHQHEKQETNRRQVGVEPVGDPGGVDPHPPDREEQQRDLDGAERREMVQQRVRQLRDGKDEDEIEQQLRIGDAAVLVRHDHAKHRAARIVRHRCGPLAAGRRP
jgi:hypothetical protein